MSFTIGFDQTEAQEMMTLSAIAYSKMNQPREVIQAAIVAALLPPAETPVTPPLVPPQTGPSRQLDGNFELVWLGVSSTGGNLMYVARDKRAPARFAVVIRGSDWNVFTDYVDDFDVLKSHDWPTASPSNTSIYVAKGAWDGMTALLGTAVPMQPKGGEVEVPVTVLELLKDAAKGTADETDVDVFVTGHSLGAAMATVVGLRLSDEASKWGLRANKVNFKTYTFAAPTVGNQDFASYYDGQATNALVQWQAFRIYNEQDAVPYGYANLAGVIDDGVPYSAKFSLEELVPMVLLVTGSLTLAKKSYVDVGSTPDTARGLSNDPPQAEWPPHCAAEVESMGDLACWVGYEHDHNTYLFLLGAPTLAIPERAVNTASIAAMRPPAGAVSPVIPIGGIAQKMEPV